LALDRLYAGPGEALAAYADAVAERLAAAEHEVEVGVRGVDDDSAGRLVARIADDLAAQVGAHLALILIRIGVGRRLHALAIGGEEVERIGRSGCGDDRRGDEGRDRGSGLEIKNVHCHAPHSMTIGRAGGRRGSKCSATKLTKGRGFPGKL